MIGEFRPERLLGRGGMGAVWLARDTLLERDVALKIGEAGTSHALVRARVEAKAIARLRHPNIIAIHHAGDVDGRPFIVTELLSGSGLDKCAKPLVTERVVTIGADLARGLAAAHSAGVLHRDIKPANAFLCDDGVAKLLDFGLAQIHEANSDPEVAAMIASLAGDGPGSVPPGAGVSAILSDGGLAGTPLYLAPEIWRGEAASRSSDVYSLGAILYELLAGKPALSGATIREVRDAALEGRFETVAAVAPCVPPDLSRLVMRCLDLRPQVRPAAEEVCHALECMTIPWADEADAESDASANPYRGLLTFGPEHRGLFFGRDMEIGAVLDAMYASPFVTVLGPSGSGKSSVVRAGVVPRVRAGQLGRGTKWRIALMVPGARPTDQLSEALAVAFGAVRADVPAMGSELAEWIRARSGRSEGPQRLMLVIDQLEEAWTLASANERAALFDLLASLASVDDVRLVTVLRADFLARLEDTPSLKPWALRAPVVIGPMTGENLRRAIVGPARARGVDLEPGLVEDLLRGAAQRSSADFAGTLPLMEFALALLWERRNPASRVLERSALSALGGLEGALALHANDAIANMPPTQRAEARRLLLALITAEGTRARREESDLRVEDADAAAALEGLVRARLVVASAGDDGAAYTIAHEALVFGWPTLHEWLEADRAIREMSERLSRATADWLRLGRGEETLFPERRVRELRALGTGPRTPDETAFVEASRAWVRRSRRRRLRLAIGASLAVGLLVSAIWARQLGSRRAAVADWVAVARVTHARVGRLADDGDGARRRSLALFDANDIRGAEDLWRKMLALEDRVDQERRGAEASLDGALSLDPRNQTARSLYADILFARVRAAELLNKRAVVPALLARLAQYDDGQMRSAQLHAPGTVRVVTEPPATLALREYRDSGRGRLVEEDLGPLTQGTDRALPPGSYLVVATTLEGGLARYPFVVQAREFRVIAFDVPRPENVPAGMIYVPAGRFLYGSADDEATRAVLMHQPLHAVELAAFFIRRTEVTVAEYLAFLGALPEGERVAHTPARLRVQPASSERCLNCPVDGLTRDNAEEYVTWLARSGRLRGARLCTEQEWERSARGADARRFPWGDGAPRPEDVCASSSSPCEVGAHPRSRSPFGVEDMSGNAWEWTALDADVTRPGTGVYRGGGYTSDALRLEIQNRAVQSHLLQVGGVRVCADAR
jgi:formylglycine-generating enzyme required for sulfatase activity